MPTSSQYDGLLATVHQLETLSLASPSTPPHSDPTPPRSSDELDSLLERTPWMEGLVRTDLDCTRSPIELCVFLLLAVPPVSG